MSKTFGATMYNWTCLMNEAYKEEKPNPHVHWHVRPRYSKDVIVGKNVFRDAEFGCHYSRDKMLVGKDVMKEIQNKFIENM